MPKKSELTPLGEMVESYRKRRGLDRAELARELELSTVTVWKQLTGRIPVTDRQLEAYGKALRIPPAELAKHGDLPFAENSPTSVMKRDGTYADTSEPLPRPLQIQVAEFELEAMKLGADEDEMAYVRISLRSPEAVTLFRMGHEDRELSVEEQAKEMEHHIEMVRRWLVDHMKRRKQASKGK